MLPSAYNNNVQLFQTPDTVVILNEMVHNARIVSLDPRPALAPDVHQWVGESRRRWEGDTLVVETTNFLRDTSFVGSSATFNSSNASRGSMPTRSSTSSRSRTRRRGRDRGPQPCR